MAGFAPGKRPGAGEAPERGVMLPPGLLVGLAEFDGFCSGEEAFCTPFSNKAFKLETLLCASGSEGTFSNCKGESRTILLASGT